MNPNSFKTVDAGLLATKDSTDAIAVKPTKPGARAQSLPNPTRRDSTAILLSRILQRRLAVYLRRLNQCRKKPLAEPVHDLRVATRRLVSPIKLLQCSFPGCKTRKALSALKKQFLSLGDLRDANILRTAIEQQQETFPDLVASVKRLRRRERRLIKRAAREIKRFKKRKVVRCVDKLVAELKEISSDIPRQARLNSMALDCAREAFAETRKRRRSIDYSDLTTIHRTRIAFKKFRYIVECLPPEMTGLGKRKLRALNDYQSKMGDIQDLVVIQSHLEAFPKQKESAGTKLDSFFRRLRHRRALALRNFRKSVDSLDQFQPPA